MRDQDDLESRRALDGLADLARRTADADASGSAPGAWASVRPALVRREARRRRRAVMAGALGGCAIVALSAFWIFPEREALTFAVDAATLESDGYIHRVGAGGAKVSFSDG